MKTLAWIEQDSVALRDFFSKVPREKFLAEMRRRCPAELTVEDALKSSQDGVARVACVKAGWEAYERELLNLAEKDPKPQANPSYRDMS